MMNDLTHVAITKGYLLLYLLLYHKADFADADMLRIQMVPLFISPPTSSIIVDIRDGEYVAANSLLYASLAHFGRLLVEFKQPTSSSAVFNGPCTSLQYRPRGNWLRSGTAQSKS